MRRGVGAAVDGCRVGGEGGAAPLAVRRASALASWRADAAESVDAGAQLMRATRPRAARSTAPGTVGCDFGISARRVGGFQAPRFPDRHGTGVVLAACWPGLSEHWSGHAAD